MVRTIHELAAHPSEWRRVGETNIVAQKIDQLRVHARRVMERRQPAMFVFGGSGLGKNHVVDAVIREYGVRNDLIRCNPQHPRDLLNSFHKATHGRGKRPRVMVFDEADLIVRSQPCLNILKLATDVAGARWFEDFRWMEQVLDEEGNVTSIKGVGVSLAALLLVMTNSCLHVLADKKLWAHAEALFSRCPPIEIPDDPLAAWEYCAWLALTTDLLTWYRGRTIPLAVRARILTWFTGQVFRLKQVSVRTLLKAGELHVLAENERALAADLELLVKPNTTTRDIVPPHQQDWAELRRTLTQPPLAA